MRARLTLLVLVVTTATAVAQTDPATPQPTPPVPGGPPPPPAKPLANPGAAPTSTTAQADPVEDDRVLTVMWAPLRAIFGLAEFTAEYRLHDKIGVSVMLGGGRRNLQFENMVQVNGTEFEAGLQGRYYVIGSFTHGMELGAEIQEEYIKFDEPLPATVAGVAAGGLTLGAFVGYKIATRFGFTFEGQLGARYLIMDPEVTGVGTPMLESQSKWMPMLHLNAGWTF